MLNKRSRVLSWALVGVLGIGGTTALTLSHSSVHAEAQPAAGGAQGQAANTLNDLSQAFRAVGKAVEPSVVNIKVRKTIEAPKGQGRRGMPPGPMQDPFFRHFFGNPDDNGGGDEDTPDFPGFPGPFGGGGELIGQGSGVIMEVDGNTGYIVTNNHVAGDADEMEVVLNDGRTITNGKLVGADPRTDLALIKIQADNLKAAKWGNSDELEKGDWVLAFGSPFGYVGSMTHGIVSALNRTDLQIIPQGYEQFIQIDAPINPGNSGGPLVNVRGEVIGINTAIASRTGGFQGIGFAIPSDLAQQITGILKEKGKVVRGWLGVGIASVGDNDNQQLVQRFGYNSSKGVLVEQVFPNTPAYGILKRGDVITKLNGKEVSDSNSLRNAVAMMAPGSEASMDVFRNGKTETVKVKLGDQPADMAAIARGGGGEEDQGQAEASTSGAKLGVALSDLTPQIARQLRVKPDEKGAVVTRVEPRSPAARAGIRPGDIISEVNGKSVASAADARDAIKGGDIKQGIALYVTSRDSGHYVFAKALPENGKK